MPRLPQPIHKPYWQTTDGSYKLYLGDVIDNLRKMPDKSVHCVVTSPPYWALRDYGAEGQLGSEETPQEYVFNMFNVFEEVRRVLRDDGTLWLNLGDTYGGYAESRSKETASEGVKGKDGNFARLVARNSSNGLTTSPKVKSGLKSGNLVGIPWRVALMLQETWILRQDIIWHKPSPMPESVKNRCTKAHEYIFLLAKRSGYYYDAEAIKTEGTAGTTTTREGVGSSGQALGRGVKPSGNGVPGKEWSWSNTSNKRSVWTVASEAYAGAHFATFPKKLIEPCILAGTSEYGCCVSCGAPFKRILETEKLTRERPNDYVKRKGEEGTGNSCANSVAGIATKTLGWTATCRCGTDEVKPCIVLDPFAGSATTLEVALNNGRYGIGIELKEEYLRENAIPRMEGALLARPSLAHLTGRKAERVEIGEDC